MEFFDMKRKYQKLKYIHIYITNKMLFPFPFF
jgi:hypothetical protein